MAVLWERATAPSGGELCQKHGVTIREILYTIGPYNLEAIGAVMLSVQKLGNVRSTSMRAMTPENFFSILEKVS